MKRIVSWFSCGSASAYATYLALQKYKEIEIVYCEVINEHSDNKKFLKDFENKFKVKINILKNEKYNGDIYKVFRERKFIKNQFGAPCTMLLKKEMRKKYQKPDDIQIFGYTAEELGRRDRLIDANPEIITDDILIDNNITKNICKNWLIDNGFELPVMYKLGYQNNNCIGCVKGGMGYWNAIRKDFPEIFDKMAKLERELGHSVCKESYLDELEPNRGSFKRDLPKECGFNCEYKLI